MFENTQYHLLDVFTDRPFAGNPLAVFPSSDGLDSATMQAIANELNLSETVFVGQPEAPDRYPIRIFTPTMELPFAGHPTVGTAHLLAELQMASRNRPLTLEAKVGPLEVTFEQELARFTTAQPIDISPSTLARRAAAQLLGLDEGQVISEPLLASCGLPYHLIELDTLEALGRALPSPSAWKTWVTPSGHEQVYLYVIDRTTAQTGALRCRMFSTEGGVREDSATGSAVAALAGKLATDRQGLGTWRWDIQQGIEMGRPSRIIAEAERREAAMTIAIAGQAVIVGTGILQFQG
ncbi:MAG: PhzF family phenazine biosynthesis protein [Halomonas sp.]|nr:PhzF family phenazine biosynthesis protein [Halomonas sp.]